METKELFKIVLDCFETIEAKIKLGHLENVEEELAKVRMTIKETMDVMNTPVNNLGLSIRIENYFKSYDIKTVYDICQRTEDRLLMMKNFGKKSLLELREVLAKLGIWLKVK